MWVMKMLVMLNSWNIARLQQIAHQDITQADNPYCIDFDQKYKDFPFNNKNDDEVFWGNIGISILFFSNELTLKADKSMLNLHT